MSAIGDCWESVGRRERFSHNWGCLLKRRVD